MAFVGLEATSTALASLPIVCPQCDRETIHIYGLEGKAAHLLSWTLPVGPRRAFVRCTVCGLARRVPRQDKKAIQRACTYDRRAAYSGQMGGYIETTLGRVNTDPGRIRRYPTQMGLQYAVLVLILLALVGIPTVAYNALQLAAELQGDTWARTGMERYDAGRFQSALFWYRRARWLYRLAGSEVKEAECAYMIGCSHYELDEYGEALVAYQDSLPVWEAIHDRDMEGDCLLYIGYLRIYLSDPYGALEALERSRLLWVEANEWRLQAEAFRGIGIAYEGLGRYNAAIKAYTEALALFEKLRDREAAAELRLWIEQLRRQLPNYGRERQEAWRLLEAA
jgi:tetratricopeptide (TPR) repeat protein